MDTQIEEVGEFGLIDRIAGGVETTNGSTVKGIGDDAAVIDAGDKYMLVSTDLMLEGIDFDLTYTPLVHLGYKSIVRGVSDIYAMNGKPEQVTVSIGLSARFTVEMVDDIYKGISIACKRYGVDLVGGDTSASMTGLTLSITAVGSVAKDKIVYRSGAQDHDLICVSGNFGAAFMGLNLLEREKRVLKDVDNPQPMFEGRQYILQRQLKPEAREDIVAALAKAGIVPSSMIDVTDGVASDILQICKASDCGARIYLNRLPIAKETFAMAEELNFDPVSAALNGGEDYEIMFTVPVALHKEVAGFADIIGHITAAATGAALVTPDENEIELKAQGFK